MYVSDKPSSGEILGSTLSTALGQGLTALAHSKMQGIRRNMQQRQLQMMGYTPEESSFLNMYPEEMHPHMFQVLNQLRTERMVNDYAKQSGQEQPQQQGEQPQTSTLDAVMNSLGGNAQQAMNPYNALQALKTGGFRPELIPQQPRQQQIQQQPRQKMSPEEYAEKVRFAHMTPAQQQAAAINEKKFEWMKKKEEAREQAELRREKRDYVNTIREQNQRSEDNAAHYRNVIKLVQSGSRVGDVQAILDKLHIGNFFRDPKTDAAQAEINSLAMGVGSAFGKVGRILGKEFESYKDSLIRLWNTPGGAVILGWNELLKQQAVKARYDAYRKIMKESNNKVPVDLEDQIDDIVMPILRKIADQIDKNLQIVMTDKMPDWSSKELNPALYEEGTEANINNNKYVIHRGMWLPEGMEI